MSGRIWTRRAGAALLTAALTACQSPAGPGPRPSPATPSAPVSPAPPGPVTPGSPPSSSVDFSSIDMPSGRLRIEAGDSQPPGATRLTLSVKVAHTADARARGLMGVRALPDSSGMVFLFERPDVYSFWMKDTPIPLDIAFWGRDGRIHQILTMTPCTQDPCPIYSPRLEFIGAVEVRGGLLGAEGVKEGDFARLDCPSCRPTAP